MPQLETIADPALFRTTRTSETPSKVDRKANVIFGANLMQVGDLNDGDARPWTVDSASLQQAQQMMSKGNNGAKARFTHPNMSSDGMGSYLGRWKNVRVDGGTLRGDLHIADAAFTSPQGDLGTYVLDLAESDPEAFGVSLATRLDWADMEEFDKKKDKPKGQKWPMRFSDIRAGDIVDEPAATRGGMFDLTTPDLRNLPAQATALLSTYFGDAEPEVVRGRISAFLDRYLSTKEAPVPEPTIEKTPVPEVTPEAKPVETPVAETSAAGANDLATTATTDLAAAERDRCKKIRALVDLAGVPDKFNTFVDAGFSVEETQAALNGILAKKNPGLSSVPEAPPDQNAKYKAEFAAEPRYAKSMTVEQFVSMRRVDDGLDILKAPMNVEA
jgi:hypothetical protein